MNTPDHITRLRPGQVFVFGSNLAGRHGAGAALTAKLRFGARPGVGQGPTGQCYAIPTKDRQLDRLSPELVAQHVRYFLQYATENPQLTFLVTKVGCGLASNLPRVIGPMFHPHPPNVILPKEFEP